MNRAWIPAGALASVSVAGLLALGPLTDSMRTNVDFPVSVDAPAPANARTTDVPVNFDIKTVGDTQTAAFTRGGRSTQVVTANSDSGQAGFHLKATNGSTSKAKSSTKTVVKPHKKKVKRANSITGVGETNSDSGLTAGGTGGKPDVGEQAPTPASDAP